MISFSGKNWEEEKLNQRLINKIKIENNLNEVIAKQILLKKFNNEEIYSIKNNLLLKNPFIKKLDFLQGIVLLDDTIKKKEHICIIGDYDVDGCVSTSLIVNLLQKLNTSYTYFIPNRITDGYGSSIKLLKKILKKETGLVIMLDNGSNSNEAINYLNKLKINSIIIDHHEIYKPHPKSNVLINPKKKCNYSDYNYLCSATLTYFFIDFYIKKKKLKINLSYFLPLVLMATVSDVMPLRKINRTIAKNVLSDPNLKKNYFFNKVFEMKKINRPINIDDFGFIFGPIVNSAGRLDNPNIIVKLFTSNKKEVISSIVIKLISLNEKRKLLEYEILKSINFNLIKSNLNSIIILEKKNLNEGLIGIIASRLKTYFNKPVIVMTKSGNFFKGSARSTDNFNIGFLIKKALDYNFLESGGGHNLAAGFTIKKENIHIFKKFLYVNDYKITPLKFKYLSKISFNAINNFFLSDLKNLEPYGEGNVNPFFLLEDIEFVNIKILKNKLITCFIKNNSGKVLPAISFNLFEKDNFYNILNNKNKLNIIVQLKENFWNNKKNLQVVIIDILKSSKNA